MKTQHYKAQELPRTPPHLISEAQDVFKGWIDSDFKNYGLTSDPSAEAMPVDVHTLTEDGTFREIFNSFDIPLDSLVMTQGQVIEFAKTLKKGDSYDYFFLLKNKEEFFVARVGFDDDGQLAVFVYRFSFGGVWLAEGRRRLVIPQLIPRLSAPLTPSSSDTLSLESAIKICKEAGLTVTKVY